MIEVGWWASGEHPHQWTFRMKRLTDATSVSANTKPPKKLRMAATRT
jgi:hypothetical protein